MGSHTWRPRSAKATAFNVVATYEEGVGWEMLFVKSTVDGQSVVRGRMVYRGLSDSELMDVIDIEVDGALHLGR